MLSTQSRCAVPNRGSARSPRWIAAAFVLALASADARAGFTVFSAIDQGNGNPPTAPNLTLAARNSFVAAQAAIGVENFDSKPVGPFPTTWNFAGNGVTATASATSTSNITVGTGTPNGTFAVSSPNYLYNDGTGPFDVTLNFSSAVAGLGFYVSDLSDGVADELRLTLTLSDSTTQTFTTNFGANNNNANLIFFGVVSGLASQTITKAEIVGTLPASTDAYGFDDVTVGLRAVPEPASLALFGIGGLGLALGAARRRTRRADVFSA